MRLFPSFVSALLVAGASTAYAATSWGFDDATLSIRGKGAAEGAGVKEKLTTSGPLPKPVSFGANDLLRLTLTTVEGKKAKRPHQAFLTLREPSTGLEDSFPIVVKDNGKGKVDISHKDLPVQLLTSSKPIAATITIASFGSSKGYTSPAFQISVVPDPAMPVPHAAAPVRYKSLAEIHHIFRDDPKSPPKIITLVFTLSVLAALPVLVGAWGLLGANANHLSKALGAAPVAHTLFFGSIVAMEGVLYMYYTSWNLFQTLPVAGGVGLVTFLSGSRALTEVQDRRLAGLR